MPALAALPRPATEHVQRHVPVQTLGRRCLQVHREACWCKKALGRQSSGKLQQARR